MVYLDNKLCLAFSELVPMIVNRDNFYHHKNSGNYTTHGTGGNGRTVYVEYETMPAKHKADVLDYYGCPYSYMCKQPLLEQIEKDHKADTYYRGYVLPNGDKLPSSDYNLEGKPQINYVRRYTEAAEWLNMLIKLTADKKTIKQELNITIAKFWEASIDLIKTRQVNLPKTPKRLREKIKGYELNGYEYLIETHKFGNGYSRKVVGEVAEAFLKEMLAMRNKHSDVVISDEYNRWAKENGLEAITPEAVGYWRKKWKNELILEREGKSTTYNQLSKQARRKRPSAPLLLINSDDNVLDLFYKSSTEKWFRPSLYVVIDAYNDYILGYAIGETVTDELVKEAYRNAQRHVAQLTGNLFTWQQIQTDRWHVSGKNTTKLEHFYNSMAVFTPAGVNNSQAKYVERSFGTVWHSVLKRMFPYNYSGHNITAKQKLNSDHLKPAYFPNVEEAPEQIEAFINAMRNTKRKGSELTRQQEWVQVFATSEKSKNKLLSTEKYLEVYGKTHDYLNGITAKGLTPTIMGQELIYELSQDIIMEHRGKKVQVIYDEADLSTVLVTDHKGLRFLAHTYELLPSAIADYESGDKERLQRLLNEKKALAPMLQGRIDDRKAVLERAQINAQSRIQAGVLVKEVTHQDQKVITAMNNGARVIDIYQEEEETDIYKQMSGQ